MNAVSPDRLDRKARAQTLLALAIVVTLVVVLGLMVPGLGLLLGAAAAFVVYRGDRRLQLALIGLGALVTVVSIFLVFAVRTTGGTHLHHAKPTIVRPKP